MEKIGLVLNLNNSIEKKFYEILLNIKDKEVKIDLFSSGTNGIIEINSTDDDNEHKLVYKADENRFVDIYEKPKSRGKK